MTLHLSAEHERAVASTERERRREALEREIEAAERNAAESIRLWARAVRRMITSAPSIGDALLEARDRAVDQ